MSNVSLGGPWPVVRTTGQGLFVALPAARAAITMPITTRGDDASPCLYVTCMCGRSSAATYIKESRNEAYRLESHPLVGFVSHGGRDHFYRHSADPSGGRSLVGDYQRLGHRHLFEDGHGPLRPARPCGLYARQAEKAGWLGLAGYLLISLFFALTTAFAFAEAFFLPLLATDAPKFVEGILGLASGSASPISLGPVPAIYALAGAGYMLGSLLFGIATFRARLLSRWAAVLLALSGPLAAILGTLLPHPLDRMAAVPMGLALAWLGHALLSERRAQAAEPVRSLGGAQLSQTGAM
jgi:hypothetical protein